MKAVIGIISNPVHTCLITDATVQRLYTWEQHDPHHRQGQRQAVAAWVLLHMEELAAKPERDALTKTRNMESKREVSLYGVKGYSQQPQINHTKPPLWFQ